MMGRNIYRVRNVRESRVVGIYTHERTALEDARSFAREDKELYQVTVARSSEEAFRATVIRTIGI